MMAATKKPIPDGVIIYSLFGENNDKVIMIRQFRYPLNDYIYEFPAGLIDPGESVKETAVREMMEETGLNFTPADCEEFLHRPHFSSAGMTDETNCTVYGYASGKPNLDHLEPNEDLSVQLVDREEAKRILKRKICLSKLTIFCFIFFRAIQRILLHFFIFKNLYIAKRKDMDFPCSSFL